jgi:alkylation response protein AidB-like acyl-CoA dehydrogenase
MTIAIDRDLTWSTLVRSARDIAGNALDEVRSGAPDTVRPPDAIADLRSSGLLRATLPVRLGGSDLGNPRTPGAVRAHLDVLRTLGAGSLSTARIWEGHANALQVIEAFGGPGAEAMLREIVEQDAVVGLWNTNDARDKARLTAQADGGYTLTGGKSFASGTGLCALALVGATLVVDGEDRGWQLSLVDTTDETVTADTSWWDVMGMRGSVSGTIAFGGTPVAPDRLVGGPEDYHRQPWLVAGVARYAAAQLGAAEQLLVELATALRSGRRDTDEVQLGRVAEVARLLEGGRLWLDRSAALTEALGPLFDPAATVGDGDAARLDEFAAYLGMTRLSVEHASLETLRLVEQALGARSFVRPSVVEQLHRDLTVYLRQPARDASVARVGRWVLGQDLGTDVLWSR